MKRKEFLLAINIIVLGFALMILVGTVAILLLVFQFDAGLIFGMLLANLFPVLLLIAVFGLFVFITLFASNVWSTLRREKIGAHSRQHRFIWLVFGGVTSVIILITVVCGFVGTPLVGVLARVWEVSNPFLYVNVFLTRSEESFVLVSLRRSAI